VTLAENFLEVFKKAIKQNSSPCVALNLCRK